MARSYIDRSLKAPDFSMNHSNPRTYITSSHPSGPPARRQICMLRLPLRAASLQDVGEYSLVEITILGAADVSIELLLRFPSFTVSRRAPQAKRLPTKAAAREAPSPIPHCFLSRLRSRFESSHLKIAQSACCWQVLPNAIKPSEATRLCICQLDDLPRLPWLGHKPCLHQGCEGVSAPELDEGSQLWRAWKLGAAYPDLKDRGDDVRLYESLSSLIRSQNSHT